MIPRRDRVPARRLDPDPETGDARYDFGDGRYLTLRRRDVREYGEARLLAEYGAQLDSERIPVVRHGRRIGTLPRSWSHSTCRPTSWLYDPRPGDFAMSADGDHWVASPTLGPGDLDAVPEFRRDEESDA